MLPSATQGWSVTAGHIQFGALYNSTRQLPDPAPVALRKQSRRVQLGHLWMRENRYLFVFLWRGPPTGLATLCNALSLGSSRGAPCPSRTTCESMRLSACACQQTVCNWWATFVAPLCSGISLKWPRPGQGRPKTAPARTAPTLLYEFNPPKTNFLTLHRLPALPPPFCIALNRSRGRRQEGIEPLPYDSVAFAGCLFEAGPIHNLHLTPTIAD